MDELPSFTTAIQTRDDIQLDAKVHLPTNTTHAKPAIVHLTPYADAIGKFLDEIGMKFAAHDYPFVRVSCRGCGKSDGTFELFSQDGRDGFDSIQWVAEQPWCDGSVAMFGGSYSGFTQWVTAAESPPNLVAIAPVAACGLLYDYPLTNNILMSHTAFYTNFVDRDVQPPDSRDGDTFSWRDVYYKRFVEHSAFHRWIRSQGAHPKCSRSSFAVRQTAAIGMRSFLATTCIAK